FESCRGRRKTSNAVPIKQRQVMAQPDPNRLSLGRMQNPVRGLLHGLAALLSAVAVVALIEEASGPIRVAVAAIYGTALIGVFTTSTLYHTIPWRSRWKTLFQRMDHIWIYALVAATFTALMVGTLDGWVVGFGIALVWGIGLLGALKECRPGLRVRKILFFQLLLGAALMAPLVAMLDQMQPRPLVLTLLGGGAYLIGVGMFVRSWPRLVPRVFSYHEVFHIVVVVAAIAHFLAVREVVLPPA
ncbi:MAG: PAQR family membrane homeostasis protein TrhA, partial [Acidimicrobiia bacterium]